MNMSEDEPTLCHHDDASMSLSRLCLDADPHKPTPLNPDQLPLPCSILPSSVTSLHECAVHEIRRLSSQDTFTAHDEDALDDGFVLCDLRVVHNKLLVWHKLFPRIQPFFALKCNPDPMVAAVLGQANAGFDCASLAEIQLALDSASSQNNDINNNANRIIYANPQRAEYDLETALQNNIHTLTFDGAEELYKIHAICQKLGLDSTTRPNMVLRILVPDEHSSVPLGEKFGVPPDQIQSLVELAVLKLKMTVMGVSFHCGSGNHNPEAYKEAIELAAEAMETINQVYKQAGLPNRAWLLDIGGGYPGKDGAGADEHRFQGSVLAATTTNRSDADCKDPDTAVQIAQSVNEVLDRLFFNQEAVPTKVIAEPGRYFVEASFALCSRIYRVRINESTKHRHYYIAQGVQGLFKDCLLCGESFLPIPCRIESNDTDDTDQTTVSCTVHGPSGKDYDVICENYQLPELVVGDWLVFDRMGAYTLSIAARNGRTTVRYVVGATAC